MLRDRCRPRSKRSEVNAEGQNESLLDEWGKAELRRVYSFYSDSV